MHSMSTFPICTVADLEIVEGGANFFFISLPFFFLSFFLILSSQKIEGGLKGGSMVFWVDPVLSPPLYMHDYID